MRIVESIKELVLIDALLSMNPTENLEEKERVARYGWLLEVQKSALETLNRILQAGGQNLSREWNTIFEIIERVVYAAKQRKLKGLDATQSEMNIQDNVTNVSSPATVNSKGKMVALVRLAFPSLQLICSGFLQLLNPLVLFICIEGLGLFGSQTEDLNISLTAIALLWSISDFVLGKKQEVEKELADNAAGTVGESTRADETEFKPIGSQPEYYTSVRISNQALFRGPMSPEALGALWKFIESCGRFPEKALLMCSCRPYFLCW